jgi:hypothetical protein
MARITVKDLQRSDTLDRQAMLAIAGGSRSGTRPIDTQGAKQALNRVVDYPPGFGARTQGAAGSDRS